MMNDIEMKILSGELQTPVYVYDLEQVKRNFSRVSGMIGYFQNQIYYAVMANNNPRVLETVKQLCGGVQVNSLHELDLVQQSLFPSDRISFTSTGLSRKMLETLVEKEICVNLDSIEEVRKFCDIPEAKKFGIRLRMPQVFLNGEFSQTDCGISESYFECLRYLSESNGKVINGIHGYCGSNIFDADFLKRSADYISECAKQFPDLEYVDFGSGFGIAASVGQGHLDLADVLQHYSELAYNLSEYFGREIQLRIEPGRAIVADAGTLYTTVTNVKRLPNGRDLVHVDAGFGDFARPRLYGVYHGISAVNVIRDVGEGIAYDIRGNTVLQDDYFGTNVGLPVVAEGSLLTIHNVGAYGMTMASGFPGKELPAEVCI